MKCKDCRFYFKYPTANRCRLTDYEAFAPQTDCKLVNDDQSINEAAVEAKYGAKGEGDGEI